MTPVTASNQFKTVREKNIIFNVIKYFEDEKERHGKQKFRPNAVMQKAAEATGVPLRTLQRLSNANSESKKIKCKKAKLSRETGLESSTILISG